MSDEVKTTENTQDDFSRFRRSLLQLTNPKDLTTEEKDNLLVDNLVFNKEKFRRYDIGGNANFVLVASYNEDSDLNTLIEERVFISTKNEDEDDILLLNFDSILDNIYDWHENIVAGPDLKSVGFKYIVHAYIGEIDIYLVFLKGILYKSFVEFMHNSLIRNLNAAEEICGITNKISNEGE